MPDTSRVRLSIVGVVVTALFCSLLARLWFLQVRESQTNVQINNESVAHRADRHDPRGSIGRPFGVACCWWGTSSSGV